MERESFVSRVRRWVTGELRPEQREEILTYLNERKELVRTFLTVSSIFTVPLNRPAPRHMLMRDVQVLAGNLPFDLATDMTLKGIYRGVKILEKKEPK